MPHPDRRYGYFFAFAAFLVFFSDLALALASFLALESLGAALGLAVAGGGGVSKAAEESAAEPGSRVGSTGKSRDWR